MAGFLLAEKRFAHEILAYFLLNLKSINKFVQLECAQFKRKYTNISQVNHLSASGYPALLSKYRFYCLDPFLHVHNLKLIFSTKKNIFK